jgi:hypothetical protein
MAGYIIFDLTYYVTMAKENSSIFFDYGNIAKRESGGIATMPSFTIWFFKFSQQIPARYIPYIKVVTLHARNLCVMVTLLAVAWHDHKTENGSILFFTIA